MAAIDYLKLEVIIVDDHSTDATPRILDRLARDLPNLRVTHDPVPQPGWVGKLNAVRYGVQQVCPETKWLLFTDADIVFGPTVLKDAIVFVEREHIDFLTCMPYLEVDSLLEELVLLTGWLRHLDWIQYPKLNDAKSRSVGIGAFMLVRRSVYDSSGGHEAIAGEACDDAALATSLKKSGAAMGFGWAGDQLRCHQYHSYRDMMSSVVRKQRIAFKDNLWAFLCTVQYLIIRSVLPLPLAVGGVAVQLWRQDFSFAMTAFSVMAFVMYIQGVLGYAVGRRFCRIHGAAPYLHPVAGALRAWICVLGMRQKLAGKPVDWRGRTFNTP
jgi:cellulose synthase/poly-beta-1,6-N-acetylglucosamine synthase-like glycosyltransferase